MLRSDNPTHPEFLAMRQCTDDRYEDRIKYLDKEFQYKMEALSRTAVARKAQIHSQFYQSVRELRERLVENLGQQWYDIQHERRRYANSTPDYGLRFPASRTQRVRDAIAYNREVSILSGIAKYRGFPAAPMMKGVSAAEAEEDFEAISV